MIHRLILALLGMILLSGCTIFELPEKEGVLLFQDDFDAVNSGWVRFHDDNYFSNYVDGSYRIQINQPNFEAWSVPGLTLSDVYVDVKATKIAGPDNNVFGILCRYTKPNDFYFFLLSSDGFAGIGVYRDGERRLLTGQSMLPADPINLGSETNNIHVECVGQTLRFFVNEHLLYEVQSSVLQSGDVGLIAGAYDTPGVLIEFDDFRVTNP